jgi:hypothetical protein
VLIAFYNTAEAAVAIVGTGARENSAAVSWNPTHVSTSTSASNLFVISEVLVSVGNWWLRVSSLAQSLDFCKNYPRLYQQHPQLSYRKPPLNSLDQNTAGLLLHSFSGQHTSILTQRLERCCLDRRTHIFLERSLSGTTPYILSGNKATFGSNTVVLLLVINPGTTSVSQQSNIALHADAEL